MFGYSIIYYYSCVRRLSCKKNKKSMLEQKPNRILLSSPEQQSVIAFAIADSTTKDNKKSYINIIRKT